MTEYIKDSLILITNTDTLNEDLIKSASDT